MYVVRHMTAPPVTVRPETPIPEVEELLRTHRFRHLPVVEDDERLVGIVTDRDIRSAYPSSIAEEAERQEALRRLAKTPVSAIMTRDPLSLSCEATLDDALFLFDRHKVGAMPVLDRTGFVIGMFSTRDLMKAFNMLFGLGEPGATFIEVEDDGQPRILTRIVQAFEDHEIPVTRLVRITENGGGSDKGAVYLRVHTYNVHAVHRFLESAGLQISRSKRDDPCEPPQKP